MLPAVVLPDVAVTGLAVGGDGIGRGPDGRVVFVRGALPGERVQVAVREQRRDFLRGDVVVVHEAAPERVAPPCLHVAAGCGGCGWQHVHPDAQPLLKAGMVAEALRRQARLTDVEVAVASALPATRYRTTVRAAVGPDGRLGFRGHRSHRVVPVDDCLVAHPLLEALLTGARAAADGGAREAVLRVGAATGERAATVLPGGRFVVVPPDVVTGPEAAIHEVVLDHRFRVSIGSFFQSGPDRAAALVQAVRAAVADAPDGPMVDLYGGVGLFAALVEPHRPVTLVEREGSATADAAENLRHRAEGAGARIVTADVDRWEPTPAALVVADPARSGLGPSGVATAAGTGARTICAISCDVAAFARDARLLADAGYRCTGATVVECFPHTPHVEVVSRFHR